MGIIRRTWLIRASGGNLARTSGLHPYSLWEVQWDFEWPQRVRTFFTVWCPRHYTGLLGPTQTTGWAPPAGLTNTSSSSSLVFPGGLPSRYWPGSTLLSFSGQPVLGYRVIWLPALWPLWHLLPPSTWIDLNAKNQHAFTTSLQFHYITDSEKNCSKNLRKLSRIIKHSIEA